MFATHGRTRLPRRAATALAMAGATAAGLGGALAWATPALAQDDPATPVVVLSKTYHPSDPVPAVGEEITFTITLANDTTAAATGYRVQGRLPAALTGGSWTCTATGAGSACGAASGTGDMADVLNVGGGGTVVYRLTGTIASEGQFTQVVTLDTGAGQACEPVLTGAGEPAATPPPDTDGAPGDEDRAGDGGRDGRTAGYGSSDYGASDYGSSDSGSGDYGSGDRGAPPVETMTCRVNNVVTPRVPERAPHQPTIPGQPAPEQPPQQSTPELPDTSPPALLAYGAVGLGALASGAALVWSTRRRRH